MPSITLDCSCICICEPHIYTCKIPFLCERLVHRPNIARTRFCDACTRNRCIETRIIRRTFGSIDGTLLDSIPGQARPSFERPNVEVRERPGDMAASNILGFLWNLALEMTDAELAGRKKDESGVKEGLEEKGKGKEVDSQGVKRKREGSKGPEEDGEGKKKR
ncbi:hypothetical protein QBC43DRAFT_293851 [Cladorrhinum sp. PSN259]|nr:hypothetical protein QBC43DRAFT_293851 [Cladorrhinum sp. PSN259]